MAGWWRACVFLLFFLVCCACGIPQPEEHEVSDPWTFEGRDGLYLELLKATCLRRWNCTPGGLPGGAGNPIWGLRLQMHWQADSGRWGSRDPRPENWWSAMNYYLSVIPFLAGVAEGLVPPRPLQPAPAPYAHLYPTSSGQVDPPLLALWRALFCAVRSEQAVQPAGPVELAAAYPSPPPIPPDAGKHPEDPIQQVMWTAHVASIRAAGPLFKPLLGGLVRREAEFGEGWGHFVHYVAAAALSTDHASTQQLSALLPSRALAATDTPPHIADFSVETNRITEILILLDGLSHTPVVGDRALLATWRAAMRRPACRAHARTLLTHIAYRPWTTAADFLWGLLRGCP